MCFHWQHHATERLHEQYKNQPAFEINQVLDKEKELLEISVQKAIKFHGSLEACTHGFFAAGIFSHRLNIAMFESLLAKLKV